MFRLTLRLALLPLLFLSVTLFLIRAQPYTGNIIHNFLMPDPCESLCFMGIRPGVTTPQQALRQLRATDLISRVGVSESLETVAWFWNKSQSPLMDDAQIPALFYDQNHVSSIRLYTRITLGDLLLELDPGGKHRIVMRQTAPYTSYNVDLYYLGDGYMLNAVVNCQSFWSQSTQLILGEHPSYFNIQARIMSVNRARHQIAVACRRNSS